MAATTTTTATAICHPGLASRFFYRSWRLPLSAARSRRYYYHSDEYHPLPGPFGPVENLILAASLKRVPEHGFTETALALGAKDAGYLDASINLFPRGAFDLVHYHLVTQRHALRDRPPREVPGSSLSADVGAGPKVRRLTLERLMANRTIIHRWQEVCSLLRCFSVRLNRSHTATVGPSLSAARRWPSWRNPRMSGRQLRS